LYLSFFFFQAEDGIRDRNVTGVQTCALPISGLEITSMADIPAGTGLGSSGSFTTALLKALHTHQKNLMHPRELAEQACHIELERSEERRVGKECRSRGGRGV